MMWSNNYRSRAISYARSTRVYFQNRPSTQGFLISRAVSKTPILLREPNGISEFASGLGNTEAWLISA